MSVSRLGSSYKFSAAYRLPLRDFHVIPCSDSTDSSYELLVWLMSVSYCSVAV